MATIREVAKAANVSITTVSNGKDNINEEPPSILFSNDKVP